MKSPSDTISTQAATERDQRYVKCVVWDLDNTLWTGTLAEDDQLSLRHDLVEVIKTLDGRGILHSIASRNEHDIASAKLREFGVFDYFLYPQINWGSKSRSVEVIAEKLNLGLPAFAFVDDQPFELAEVAHALPDVLCLPADRALQVPDMRPFQPRFVTDDSKLRRMMYRQDQQRGVAENEFAGTNEEFLASLDMKLTIAPAREADLQRAEELTIRTHQLNSTGRFYSYDQLNELRHDDRHQVLVASLEDRFGPSGRIGLSLVESIDDTWVIKLILMSCRVVSRGIGRVMLQHIQQAAHKAGVQLLAEFVPTPQNRMMYVTLKFSGFHEVGLSNGAKLLEFDFGKLAPLPNYLTVSQFS